MKKIIIFIASIAIQICLLIFGSKVLLNLLWSHSASYSEHPLETWQKYGDVSLILIIGQLIPLSLLVYGNLKQEDKPTSVSLQVTGSIYVMAGIFTTFAIFGILLTVSWVKIITAVVVITTFLVLVFKKRLSVYTIILFAALEIISAIGSYHFFNDSLPKAVMEINSIGYSQKITLRKERVFITLSQHEINLITSSKNSPYYGLKLEILKDAPTNVFLLGETKDTIWQRNDLIDSKTQ